MTALVVRADARNLPLPDESVDLIVTSPPYWNQRDYTDNGASLVGQIGNEPTPREYIDNLMACTEEWVRVLKPSGSIFVVLADKYSDRADGGPSSARSGREDRAKVLLPGRSTIGMARRKSVGLIARAKIIWSKPSPMPESVADRVRVSHEDIVHMVKQERYYSAVDEIRTPVSDYARPRNYTRTAPPGPHRIKMYSDTVNPLGALPGSVWEIATQPLKVPAHLELDHFAAFPPALVRRIVLGWSPPGICTACGDGRRPVRSSLKVTSRPGIHVGRRGDPVMDHNGNQDREGRAGDYDVRITGYACACPTPHSPTRPALVVDAFGGTGTTALVASVHGRIGLSFDLSHDYGRLAQWRTTDPGERARARGLPKPPPVSPAQGSLFDGLDGVVA